MNKVKNEAEKQNNKLSAVLKEHEELTHLFIHIDTNGWNLVNFFIVMNFALISAIGLLLTQGSPEKLIFIILALCVMGIAICIAWFFLYGRLRLHHRIHLFRLYELEGELKNMGFPLNTLKSTFQKTHRGKRSYKEMKYLNPEGNEIKMKFYETREALKLIHILMGFGSIIWGIVFIRYLLILLN